MKSKPQCGCYSDISANKVNNSLLELLHDTPTKLLSSSIALGHSIIGQTHA